MLGHLKTVWCRIFDYQQKNRHSRTTCSYFCRRGIKAKKKRNTLACNLDKTEVDNLCSCFRRSTLPGIDVGGYTRSPTPAAQDLRVFVDSHQMLSKHVDSVWNSAIFSISTIGRIKKYLDRDKCFLLYLKLNLSFMGTDSLLPVPLGFGMHYR